MSTGAFGIQTKTRNMIGACCVFAIFLLAKLGDRNLASAVAAAVTAGIPEHDDVSDTVVTGVVRQPESCVQCARASALVPSACTVVQKGGQFFSPELRLASGESANTAPTGTLGTRRKAGGSVVSVQGRGMHQRRPAHRSRGFREGLTDPCARARVRAGGAAPLWLNANKRASESESEREQTRAKHIERERERLIAEVHPLSQLSLQTPAWQDTQSLRFLTCFSSCLPPVVRQAGERTPKGGDKPQRGHKG